MVDIEKGQNQKPAATLDKINRPSAKRSPRSNCLLGFCRLINFLTAVCALLCAVAHGMALMIGEGSDQVSIPAPSFDFVNGHAIRYTF